MKYLKVLTVLVMCLALSSIALAEMPKKCTYPAETIGGVKLLDGSYLTFVVVEPITITVLEEMDVPLAGTGEIIKVYRFSADYDKPTLHCPQHGGHTWEESKGGIPVELWDRFFFAAKDGTCTN